ncbi:MAG: hypothetical protein ACFFC7_02510 [Candidatus Hermodarchaeota archaeon]
MWEEAKALVNQLYVKAQNQHSVSLICETLLLLARFATIDGKLSQTLKYYDQARLTATEKKLGILVDKVDAEQKLFETEFSKWQDTSLQARLKEMQMEEYIKEVQKMIKMDFPQKI